ncbi:MAG: ABC transporter permease [Gemmatimonadota bacterium]
MHRDRGRRYLRFFGARPEADVEDEIGFHLEMRERELIALGMATEEARAEARRRFGDRARLQAQMQLLERERTRSVSRLASWHALQSDVSFVVRTLVRQPLFTLSVILTLGLSIGANASIFTAVNAYLLKPFPVRDPDRLAAVAIVDGKSGMIESVSYPMYRSVLQLNTIYEDAVAWLGLTVALRTEGDAVRGFVIGGSDNYFSALGVRAALGRVYTPEDAHARAPVIVLTNAYWTRLFNRDPLAIGKTLFVNERPFTIIGVLSPKFNGTQPLILPDAIIPVESAVSVDADIPKELESMGWTPFRILAYLKPGVTIERARSAVEQLTKDLAPQYPEVFADRRLVTEMEIRTRPEYAVSRLTPWVAGVFFGMVGLALLVACANVANLLLVRATVRRSEIAIRSAIGATPARVVRLLLTESLLLSAASLVVAYGLARFCTGWLNRLPLAIDVPISFGLELDGRVFAYAAGVSLLAGLLSGVVPALLSARAPVSEVLRDGGRSGSAGRGRTRLRSMLVVSQVAVSFLLLVSGGLFIRSAHHATEIDLGFSRDRLLLGQVDLALNRVEEGASRQVQDRLLEAIGTIPGVERVALSTFLPLSGNYDTRTVFVDEHPPQAPDGVMSVAVGSVTPGLIATLGMHLLEGRDFTAQDDTASPPVAIVNRVIAEALWPQRDPIGQRLRLRKDGPVVEVVGLSSNVTLVLLGEEDRPMLLLPIRQHPSRQTTILTKSRGVNPSALTAEVRTAVAAVNPTLLLYGVRTMATQLDEGLAFFFVNIGATLATAIGLLGLLQTIVGLYGVLSYSVAQRAREFGIRMALGAQAGAMIRDVMRHSARLVASGLAIGAVLAVTLTGAMRSVLVGVSPTDTLAFGGALVVLGGLAMLSSYLPAWRASQVEPASAVRGD